MEEEQGVVGCGGGGGCRGRGCRATCDAVTSANRPFPLYCSFLIPSNPLPFSPLRPPSFFRAAHEPHPRNRTRPPNYGLEFELAVNPFIALPPPPAWQSLPDWLTAVSLPLSHLRLATLERRVQPRYSHPPNCHTQTTRHVLCLCVCVCVWLNRWMYNAPCNAGATCTRCADRSRLKAWITRHFFWRATR